MTRETTYATIQGTLLRTTDKAAHFRIESISGTPLDEPHTMWIPLSQTLKQKIDVHSDGNDEFTVARWILEKAELI